jgi:hypothetical protein
MDSRLVKTRREGRRMAKRYQYVEDHYQGRPVIADYGWDGPSVGRDAVKAWYVQDGEVFWFDPTDTLRWREDSDIVAEFDDWYDAIHYLRRKVDRSASSTPD